MFPFSRPYFFVKIVRLDMMINYEEIEDDIYNRMKSNITLMNKNELSGMNQESKKV